VTGPPHGEPDHFIANGEIAGVGAEFRHNPCQVASLTGRKRRREHVVQRATPDHRLTRIDAGCLNLDQHFAGSRNRTRYFAYLKNIDATIRIELHCFRHEVRSNPASSPNILPSASGSGLKARLEQPGKGLSHADEDHDPQYGHEDGQRQSRRAIKMWKLRMLRMMAARIVSARGT